MSYTTQMDAAKKGIITNEMKIVAAKEDISVEELRRLVAEGKIAIPANRNHKTLSPEGVGQGLKTKDEKKNSRHVYCYDWNCAYI